MAEILLVRHGQSANNAQEQHLRVPDPALTEVGTQQAIALAAWLQHHPISHLYCSPFLRSLETIRPIAEATQLPVRVRGDLFELGGCYSGHEIGKQRGEPGLGRQHLAASYPQWEIDAAIGDHGWWGRDYETFEQGVLRAASVSQWLATELSGLGGMHVLIIHADFKRLLLEAMFHPQQLAAQGVDLVQAWLYNTGVTACTWTAAGWELSEFNSTTHLPAKLVT